MVLVGNFITASGHFTGFGPTWVGSIKELVQILDFIHVRFFLNRVGRLLVLIFFLIFHEEDASRFTCYSSIR